MPAVILTIGMVSSILIIILATLFMIEWLLEARIAVQTQNADCKTGLYYSWAYYTHSGIRFGFWRGLLKLQMSPAIIYRNMPNQRTPYFSTNRQGFRGVDVVEGRKTEGRKRKRLILLGGSTAFGTGLASDDETAAVKMEKNLGAEVVNAAVIGHRSGQELAFIATELLDLEPDLILSLSGWNDFSQYWLANVENGPLGFCAFELIDSKIEEAEHALSESLFRRVGQLHRLFFPVLSRSLNRYLNRYPNRYGGRYLNSRLNRTAGHKKAALTGADWKIPRLADSFARNVQKAARLSVAHGAGYCCLLQPVRALADEKHEPFAPLYAEFRRLVKQQLSANNVSHLDLNESKFGLKDSLFRDFTHLTSDGQTQLARVVGQELQLLGLQR